MLAICGGLMRTGSVAMFQIMREIVEVRGVGFAPVLEHGREGEHFDEECCRWASQPEVFVAKLHQYRTSLNCDSNGNPQVKVVMTVRDIRDVVVSLMHFRDSDFATTMHANAYKNWVKDYETWVNKIPESNLLIVKYEDMVADRFTTVLQVGRFLDIALNAPEASGIDKKWSAEANIGRAKEGHAVSSKDFMSHRHIYKGSFGMWRDELTEDEVQRVHDDHGEWLKDNGYEV